MVNRVILTLSTQIQRTKENMKARAFGYNSGRIVWVIDPAEIHSAPYEKPYHGEGYNGCTTFSLSERMARELIIALPFKYEKTRWPYYWLESNHQTLKALAASAGIKE